MWVTNGHRAGVYLVMTKTDTDDEPAAQGHHRLPRRCTGRRGSRRARRLEKLGYKGVETTELTFDDCRVPATQVLGGKEGSGFQHIMSALEVGRINVAARGVGVAQAAFDDSIRYAQKREAFGKPIFEHQAQQLRLAEMLVKIRAARLLTLDAARKKDSGARSDLDAGIAKLYATEIANEVRARRDAHPRRRRLQQGTAARALLPRCAADDHRRRHERHPEDGDRAGRS